MSFETFKDILIENNPCQLSISGGEPFLHPDLTKMLYFAIDSGVRRINVVTNGTKLNKNIRQLEYVSKYMQEKSVIYSISLSIDALQKRQSNISDALKILRSCGFRIKAYMYPVVCPEAQADFDIEPFVSLINECQILFPIPLGKNTGVFLSREEWAALWRSVAYAWIRARIPVSVQRGYSDELLSCSDMGQVAVDALFVDYDGRPSECCLLSEIERQGEIGPMSACKVKEGDGCLAITVLNGRDWRFLEDEKPPCPLWTQQLTGPIEDALHTKAGRDQ